MRLNAIFVTIVIAASAVGCSSTSGMKMPSLAWWKKSPPQSSVATTSPLTPQLPSTGSVPAVTTPSYAGNISTPSAPATSNATYPEQPASYPATGYPTTSPAVYGAPATGNPYPSTAAPAGSSMPAASTGGMTPQTGPYSPVYGAAGGNVATATYPNSAPTSAYPSTPSSYPNASYPSTPVSGATTASSNGAGPGVVTNSYADPSGGAASGPADDRYASRYDDRAVGGSAATPASSSAYEGGRYGNASTAGANATSPNDQYSPPGQTENSPPSNAAAAAEGRGQERYARDNYQPGNYEPGNTGYEPGNTGYNPTGTPYNSGVSSNYAATQRRDPYYRPGATSDFRPPAGVPNSPTGASPERYAMPPNGVRPAGYDSPSNGSNTTPMTTPAASDRYGSGPATDRYQ